MREYHFLVKDACIIATLEAYDCEFHTVLVKYILIKRSFAPFRFFHILSDILTNKN